MAADGGCVRKPCLTTVEYILCSNFYIYNNVNMTLLICNFSNIVAT